jgi:hypothetical protein
MTPPLAVTLTALVLVNLIPLAGVVWYGWSAFDVMLLFWAETSIIGVFAAIRMSVLLVTGRDGFASVAIPVFVAFFGMFNLAHGYMIVASFRPDLLHHFDVSGVVDYARATPAFATALMALAGSHLVSFLIHYLGRGEYRKSTLDDLVMAPFSRMMLTHVVLIAGAAAISLTGRPAALIAVLVIAKIGLDARAHVLSHLMRPKPTPVPPGTDVAPARAVQATRPPRRRGKKRR